MMARRLEIDGWSSGLRFSACHVIPGHEKCGRLHGHTYAVHIRIKGRPNEQHIIADFGLVKEVLREVCEVLDHKVLLPKGNPDLKVRVEDGKVHVVMGKKDYSFPEEDVLVLDIPSATAEALARYILDLIAPRIVSDNLEEIDLGLDEGVGQGAWARNTY
jgi:6-pyruvoyltetrahydropterin/6-carboxytetrahydropterin synthase